MRALCLILILFGCDKERPPARPTAPSALVSPDGAVLVECKTGETAVILYLPDGAMMPGCQQ